MLRAIREISPTYIVGENVYGLVNWNGGLVFHEVQTDLEAEGYEILPVILPACAVNAPHKRERVWFVAHRTGELQQRNEAGECGNKRRENVQQEYRETNPIQPRAMGKDGIIANPDHHGPHAAKNGQSDNQGDDISLSGAYATVKPSRCGSKAVDANTKCDGLEKPEKSKQPIQLLDVERNNTQNDATNPRCSERENWLHGKEPGRQTTEFGNGYTKFGAWSQFPITEPTICGRNDGIPTELDGITFPKWRNESIKAYGNAIVPQIAYQIFKSINQMQQSNIEWHEGLFFSRLQQPERY